jgi:hypothetical protein
VIEQIRKIALRKGWIFLSDGIYFAHMHGELWRLAERLGSGDGERKTLLTRQIAFEPLPASVLLGVFRGVG